MYCAVVCCELHTRCGVVGGPRSSAAANTAGKPREATSESRACLGQNNPRRSRLDSYRASKNTSDRADPRDLSGRQWQGESLLLLVEWRVGGCAATQVVLRLVAQQAVAARDETRSCRYSVSSCSVQATSKEACGYGRLWQRSCLWLREAPCAEVQREATAPVYVLCLGRRGRTRQGAAVVFRIWTRKGLKPGDRSGRTGGAGDTQASLFSVEKGGLFLRRLAAVYLLFSVLCSLSVCIHTYMRERDTGNQQV